MTWPLAISADFDGETLSTAEITPEIVWRKLVDLNPNKSPGPDKWHPHFIRELADVICIPLSIILNKSLKEDVHKTWLKAIITAIYKKGVKSMPENYRPVSLTSVISKIMESIIRDAIISHMTDNDLISDAQHGFVPGRNCLTQLLICMEDWTNMLEKREVFDLIYTDFSKAFDSVPHQRLYIKLHNIGIRGHILKWIKSLLTGRTQCVSVEGEISTWSEVTSGIPQGSVIGPLLFVIFINDMPDEVKHNVCKLFADDCKLYGAKLLNGKTKSDLEQLEQWSYKWQLPFNTKKCKTMHFGNTNSKQSYSLNGHILETSSQEKDLGVIVDVDLKFHVHTASVIKKANQLLGVIKRSYKSRDPHTILLLYKSMIRTHLEYGNTIWGPHYQTDIVKVEGVQRRVTKLISGMKDIPYQERLKALNLPSLQYRRKRGNMIVMYKIINGIVRIDSNKLLSLRTNTRTRGHNRKIFKEHATKLCRINNFTQKSTNDWNSLPLKIISAPTLNNFKNQLDIHWSNYKFAIPTS